MGKQILKLAPVLVLLALTGCAVSAAPHKSGNAASVGSQNADANGY